MINTTHLEALELGLSNERIRLAEAKKVSEKRMRQVWIAQIEKEIAAEKEFLGLSDKVSEDLNDDELLAALGI